MYGAGAGKLVAGSLMDTNNPYAMPAMVLGEPGHSGDWKTLSKAMTDESLFKTKTGHGDVVLRLAPEWPAVNTNAPGSLFFPSPSYPSGVTGEIDGVFPQCINGNEAFLFDRKTHQIWETEGRPGTLSDPAVLGASPVMVFMARNLERQLGLPPGSLED